MDFRTDKQYGIVSSPTSQSLISEMRGKDIDFRVFPSPRLKLKRQNYAGKKILRNLAGFDWLILTDILAAEYFLKTLENEQIDLFDLDLIKVCALGEAVSDRLRFSQIHADLVTSDNNPHTVIRALQDFVMTALKSVRFLLVQDDKIFQSLSGELPRLEKLDVYLTENTNSIELAKLKALIQGGAIDVFLFCSIEEIESLRLLFPEVHLKDFLGGSEVIALEPRVYQSLREKEIKARLMAK